MSHPPADADQARRPDRRNELIKAAQEHWASALTDLGGRNTLLYFKDRRSGTLDLAHADPEMLDAFISSGSARITRLFRDVTSAPTRSAGSR